ncbi:MAG: hypothetical protein ABI473_06865 [Candidatus Dormibacter sp.]
MRRALSLCISAIALLVSTAQVSAATPPRATDAHYRTVDRPGAGHVRGRPRPFSDLSRA